MSADERAHFEEFGFVVIKDALPSEDHAALCAAVERLRDQKIAEGVCARRASLSDSH